MLKYFIPTGLIFLASLAHAAVPLSSYDTILAIQRDGTVLVVEKFTPVAASGYFLWSTPTQLPGSPNTRQINLLQVTTFDGRPIRYTQHRQATKLELEINGATGSGVRIVYAISNAIDCRTDRQELLWNLGESWRGSVGSSSFFVQVPPELANDFRAQAWLRGRGVVPVKVSDPGPDGVSFQAPRALTEFDQFVLDVVLPPGGVAEPTWLQRTLWFLEANTIILLPLGVLLLMLVLRWAKASNSQIAVPPQYEPPEDMTPAEIGMLVDDSLDPRDVTATIVDLAVRGFIRLEQCTPDDGVPFEGQDFVLRRMKPMPDWVTLTPHEQTVLFHLFYGGEWTKLSSLTLRFYTAVPAIRTQVMFRLRDKGMYRFDPGITKKLRFANLGIFCICLVLLQHSGKYSFSGSWLISVLAIGTSAVILYLLGRGLSAKTLKGVSACARIRGFQDFLDCVEKDQLERLPADLFERWLAYAIALGVEHHWANNFLDAAIAPPAWFEGFTPEIFNIARLERALELFSWRAGFHVSVAPRGGRTTASARSAAASV